MSDRISISDVALKIIISCLIILIFANINQYIIKNKQEKELCILNVLEYCDKEALLERIKNNNIINY